MVFKYRARDSNGIAKDGEIEAQSQDEAVKKLQAQGLIVISCKVIDSLSETEKINKSFISEFKRNMLLIKGLLFKVNCCKCKKQLKRVSLKKILDNKFICNSCFEALKAENKKIIFEIIEKYVSNKDGNFREGIRVLYNSISNIGLEPYSLSRGKNILQTNLENLKTKRGDRKIDDIIYKKSLYENSLTFLEDLEKIQKLLKNKGIVVDYLTILSMFIEFMDTEYNKSVENLSLNTYNTIVKEFGKNVTKKDVIKLFIEANWKFDSDATFDVFYKTLDKLNLAYTKDEIADLIKEIKEKKEIEEFEQNLGIQQEKDIGDFRNLSGHEFEEYVQKLFELRGYTTVRTPLTGDQGADLIISKDNTKTVVQIKKYEGSVSNKAVQEIVAAKTYYKVDRAMVVTNSSFTSGAIDLALANDVELWDGQKLENVIKELKISKVKQNLFEGQVEYEKAIYDTLAFLSTPEELEIFKIIMIKFLDPTLNLDSLKFQEPAEEFVEKRKNFESSSEYAYLIDFSKRPSKDVLEYGTNITKLRGLLKNKGFNFDTQELNILSSFERQKQGRLVFKKLMLSYPVNNLIDYLENFVILYRDEITVLKNFRRVHLYIAQNNYSNPKDKLKELEKEGVDIRSFENQMSFTRGLEMNFDSEKNAHQFIIGFSGPMVFLISSLKKLLSENKVELISADGKQLNNEELIKMIVDIKYSEIKEYNSKKKSLREFKVRNNTVFSLDLISFLESETREDVLKEIVNLFTQEGIIKNDKQFYQNIIDAEKIVNSALGQNIAIPNASSDVSENMAVAVGISRKGIDFNSLDGSLVKLVFMVAWNDKIFGDNPGPRLKILAEISRLLKDESIRGSFINAGSRHETFLILKESFQRN